MFLVRFEYPFLLFPGSEDQQIIGVQWVWVELVVVTRRALCGGEDIIKWDGESLGCGLIFDVLVFCEEFFGGWEVWSLEEGGGCLTNINC